MNRAADMETERIQRAAADAANKRRRAKRTLTQLRHVADVLQDAKNRRKETHQESPQHNPRG